MARIAFSALIEEIVGKLAGSVFQDSYQGFQIRTRVSPRNPQSTYQQLRRGEFANISSTWRTLSTMQRQSFIDAAVTEPEALNLFISTNVNLSLIDEDIVSEYLPFSAPGSLSISIISITPAEFIIQATGSPSIVPADTKMLLYATTDKPPTRIFTNPSEFSPILSFDEGTDLSLLTNVINAWNLRFGVLRADRQICIKTVLIDKRNGQRGAEAIICSPTNPIIIMANLQEVTDEGNVTTNQIIINNPTVNGMELVLSGADTGPFVSWNKTGGIESALQASNITANRTFELPNNSGTLALAANMVDADTTGMITFLATASDFINDAAAAAGGIVIGQLYHTSGVVKIRLA